MGKVYLILNEVEITSLEQLEELIVDFSEESKTSLRQLFESATS